MAAISTLSHRQRKKPATYGKSSREADPWSITKLDAFGDGDNHATSKQPLRRPAKPTDSNASHSRETRPHTLKPVKTHVKPQDAWDVPSDDDPLSPIRSTSPSKFATKLPSVNAHQETDAKLAPWEEKAKRRKLNVDTNSSNGQIPQGSQDSSSPETQLNWELSEEVARTEVLAPKAVPTKTGKKARKGKPPETISNVEASPPASSAAARLQAKRQLAGSKSQSNTDESAHSKTRAPKRTQPQLDGTNAIPRKRIRGDDDEKFVENEDVVMGDGIHNLPSTQKGEELDNNSKSSGAEIYDLPNSSSDELKVTETINQHREPVRNESRRGRLKPRSKEPQRNIKPVTRHMSQAALSDSETPEANTRSPSMPSVSNSRPGTPQRNTLSTRELTTPPKKGASSHETDEDAVAGMTPKQAQIWGQLLPTGRVMGSPSILPIHDLKISSSRKTLNNPTGRRTRLVDRLKASAPSSDNDLTDESEESDDDISNIQSDTLVQDICMNEEPTASRTSQGHSQTVLISEDGPKITYAKSRSYLQEESFEDGLMFELTSETPQRPTADPHRAMNSQPGSQKSAFDLDDSEDESGPIRLRTVHELRAGGGNQRFMDDIGGLLDDIADHNNSARSRRRSAIIDIGVRLLDATFVEKMFRQGFEQQLLAECEASYDEIANFALAMAFVAMMTGDPPKHVVQSLRDGGILPWFLRFLTDKTDSKQLVKDRKNNMSRAAQTSFLGFVGKFTAQHGIWGEQKPEQVAPRLVALKALDQIIRRLRQLREKVELVGSAEIELLLPTTVELSLTTDIPTEVTLAISILESVSTSALALTWRATFMERLATIVTSLPRKDGPPVHLLFLTLRLCMNLTNDNVMNCRAFSSSSIILYLLQTVRQGFENLNAEVTKDQRAINLDLLVLAMGILINVAEHDDTAGSRTTSPEARALLVALVDDFQHGQKRVFEAESVEESSSNVAYGYLSIVLANLCRNAGARDLIASQLPSQTLAPLVAAVEEFVVHHQQVDTMNFAGDEGADVWTAFTERLKGILVRLKVEAGLP